MTKGLIKKYRNENKIAGGGPRSRTGFRSMFFSEREGYRREYKVNGRG